MKKPITLALAVLLAGASLRAQAQITLNGVIDANEIGTTAGKYTSLGAFTTAHTGSAGFGLNGLLRMYAANSSSKLYIALAGSIESGGNNFQLYLNLPGKTSVPAGTALPAIAGDGTAFATSATDAQKRIGGTKMDMPVNAAIALTGGGDVQAAVFSSATSATAQSIGGGVAITPNGTPSVLTATGAYALFNNTRVAYKAPPTNISDNPGNSNGGGAGSYAVEYEFDRAALGLPSGASIIQVMAAYVSGDAYWSSDIIPEITGNGNNNLGFQPDFTALAGTQAATINVAVLSSRQADDAVVAMSVFPNPAQGKSTITYQVLGGAQAVAVRVTDLLGREVRTLVDSRQNAGFQEVSVTTGDLAVGAYFVKVQVGDKIATRRLAVTR